MKCFLITDLVIMLIYSRTRESQVVILLTQYLSVYPSL
jgi:hypothetical protein